MCRFVLYLGEEITLSSLVTDPTNSIIHQSFDNQERVEPLNGDGFGVAWYAPHIAERPALFRAISPAWNNQNLLRLAPVVQSTCVLAHVRAASPGLPVIQLNCHPFVYGRLAFMHNGVIPQFQRLRRRILNGLSERAFNVIEGSTDSEYAFAMFIDRLDAAGSRPTADDFAVAMESTIRDIKSLLRVYDIDEPLHLNFAVTDGRVAAVTRYATPDADAANSLYTHTGRRYICENGVCRMIEPDEATTAIIISSERLSDDPGWHRTPSNSIVLVREDRSGTVRPIE
jgi:predicted glutamine amidotransferase